MTRKHDPFAFELFKNATYSIADEMALTVLRTAYSSVLKGSMDYSTAICDGDGKMVAQGLTLPQHLCSIPPALASVLRHYDNDMRPGDVYILNDPFDGGMHLPDIFIFKPIYFEGQRVAFRRHHLSPHGRRWPRGRLQRSRFDRVLSGRPTHTAVEAVRGGRAQRHPVEDDREERAGADTPARRYVRAQLSACHTGESAFLELVERHGAATARAHMAEIIDYTERLTRAAIRELPDGTYDFEDWLDDDGIDFGKPVRIRGSSSARKAIRSLPIGRAAIPRSRGR